MKVRSDSKLRVGGKEMTAEQYVTLRRLQRKRDQLVAMEKDRIDAQLLVLEALTREARSDIIHGLAKAKLYDSPSGKEKRLKTKKQLKAAKAEKIMPESLADICKAMQQE